MNSRRNVLVALSALMIAGGAIAHDPGKHQRLPTFNDRALCKHVFKGEPFNRTELYFGLSRPGGAITETEFQQFIDGQVTPSFPDGLTLIEGKGQFKGANGEIVQEGSKLLILFYPLDADRNAAVEAIREAYKSSFEQESVLRVDDPTCISF